MEYFVEQEHKIVIPIIILNLILSTSLISRGATGDPILSVTSVESQQVSYGQIQNYTLDPSSQISGNVWFLLIINSTFVFPQNSTYSGAFGFGCGISFISKYYWLANCQFST